MGEIRGACRMKSGVMASESVTLQREFRWSGVARTSNRSFVQWLDNAGGYVQPITTNFLDQRLPVRLWERHQSRELRRSSGPDGPVCGGMNCKSNVKNLDRSAGNRVS